MKPKHPSAHPLVDPKTLRDWLEKQPKRKIVGKTRTPEACPCQQCIIETAGLPADTVVGVGETKTSFAVPGKGTEWIENPAYLENLINEIDAHGDRLNPHGGVARISATTVLKLLRKAAPEVAPK